MHNNVRAPKHAHVDGQMRLNGDAAIGVAAELEARAVHGNPDVAALVLSRRRHLVDRGGRCPSTTVPNSPVPEALPPTACAHPIN